MLHYSEEREGDVRHLLPLQRPLRETPYQVYGSIVLIGWEGYARKAERYSVCAVTNWKDWKEYRVGVATVGVKSVVGMGGIRKTTTMYRLEMEGYSRSIDWFKSLLAEVRSASTRRSWLRAWRRTSRHCRWERERERLSESLCFTYSLAQPDERVIKWGKNRTDNDQVYTKL